MVRRRKRDVLPQLPHISREILLVPLDHAELSKSKQYLPTRAHHHHHPPPPPPPLPPLHAQKPSPSAAVVHSKFFVRDDDEDDAFFVDKNTILQGDDDGVEEQNTMNIGRISGVMKIRYAVEWLSSFLMHHDESAKIVVFAHHQDVLDGIQNGLERLYMGQTKNRERQGKPLPKRQKHHERNVPIRKNKCPAAASNAQKLPYLRIDGLTPSKVREQVRFRSRFVVAVVAVVVVVIARSEVAFLSS
jgi:hypothetical protein